MTFESARLKRRQYWSLDPNITFLNHGSFGACPTMVIEKQRAIQDELEREPVAFFLEVFPDRLDYTKKYLGSFLDTQAESLALIRNTTEGVNAVLSSIDLRPNDEILVSNHTYPACLKIAFHKAEKSGARIRVFDLDPEWSHDEMAEAFAKNLTPKTRLALMDHVTSATGMVFPVQAFISACRHMGVISLIDGAHAPGMLDLSLNSLEPDFYVGNLHKWCCAPKGAAFLFAAPEQRSRLRPTNISHGFEIEQVHQDMAALFDWPGTFDPSAWLTVPTALEFISQLKPGGLEPLRGEMIALRREVENLIAKEIPMLSNQDGGDSWMRTFRLPPARGITAGPLERDPLQRRLNEDYRIQVPVTYWPKKPERVLRISVAPYNTFTDYEILTVALRELIGECEC